MIFMIFWYSLQILRCFQEKLKAHFESNFTADKMVLAASGNREWQLKSRLMDRTPRKTNMKMEKKIEDVSPMWVFVCVCVRVLATSLYLVFRKITDLLVQVLPHGWLVAHFCCLKGVWLDFFLQTIGTTIFLAIMLFRDDLTFWSPRKILYQYHCDGPVSYIIILSYHILSFLLSILSSRISLDIIWYQNKRHTLSQNKSTILSPRISGT